MKWKQWAGKLHLWLGLPTGLVVIVMGITGAIYCFAPEIQELQSYRTVQKEARPFIAPSRVKEIAATQLPGKFLSRIYYDAPGKSIMALLLKKDAYNYSVFINPYNGEVLKVRNNDRDFLTVVLQIHRTLKIPYGHDIIRWSTVIFLLMIITGLILWWPKRRRTARQGFVVMWRASPKRLSYDLHKVFGFYVSWIAIFMALTGLMFAFEAFAGFTYRITGARHSIVQAKPHVSDTSLANTIGKDAVDIIWNRVVPDLHKKYKSIMFVFPAASNGALLVRANPAIETLYQSDFRHFNPYTGEEFPGNYVWGRYSSAHTVSDHIKRMNYDLHTGALFRLPGRIALFFAALVIASLPVTGFYFWWGKQKKSRKLQLVKRRKAQNTR